MRPNDILTGAFQYTGWLAIAFHDGPTSSHTPTIKVLNITGDTNSSLARNGTLFNATEISNFTISNATMTFANTITLPRSFLSVFESATAASELQSVLSTVSIHLSTSSVPESHGTSSTPRTVSTTSREGIFPTTGAPAINTIHGTASRTVVVSSNFSSRISPAPFENSAMLSSSSLKLPEATSTKLQKLSTPVDASSETTTPDPSMVQYISLSVGHTVPAATTNSYGAANKTYNISSPGLSLPLHASTSNYSPTSTSNASLSVLGGAKNISSNAASLGSMLGDALTPKKCRGLVCKEIPSSLSRVLALNSTSSQFSTSSDISIDDAVDRKEPTEEEMSDDGIQLACETSPLLRLTQICGNATEPKGIEPNATEANTAKPTGSGAFNYKQYFEDLNDQNQFFDDDDITDADYFALTVENMRDSQVEHWYNCWSVVAQEEPEWKKYGEWGAFWREYLHEPNFRCPNGFASCNYQPPSIQEIRRMFPNNRPLGRRVLFTTLIYELMHSYTNDLEVRFKDTDLRFQTLLPDIIQTFTLQVKSDKATLCEIYRQIINSAINVVMDLSIAAFTDGVGQVLTSKLFNLIEKNVFRMANYMNAEKLERALAAAGNAFDHINWEKFDWEKEYSTIHKQITEHMWGRDKILSTLRAEFHHIEHDVGTHAYDSLRDAKHSAIAAHFLHDTFSHVDENGDDSTKRALQETMEYFSKNGFPRAVLKASKLPSKEGREIRKEARHAITIFRKLSFAPSKLAQEWGAPMTTNVVGQLAIWPMFHLPQQWAASFYHPGNYWGKHIGGAEDPPEWHNERMPEHTRESGPVDNVNGPGWQNSLINEAYRAWPRNKLTEKHEQVASGLDGTLEAALPTIVGGIGSGWICSDFEGDWKDDNKVNTELLRDRVSVELEAGRRQVWTLFKDMYDGAVPEPGRPSMVARWMLARNWVGKDQKGSIEYDLHNIEDFHKKFELGYVKDLASSVLASGYNYLKCSHREDAVEKCAKGGLEYQQIFCPEPETDPTLVCQAARWYFSNTAPHEIDMVAIDSISRFGAMHGFRFNREDMLAEMWANYKHYGNEGIKREWGVEALEHDDHPRGFRLPVCMYEDNAYDVHHHQRAWWKNWNFPATCGNYAANETADFMKAVSLKPGSTKHSSTDWTFADRIPRVLWNRTPYTVYMSMCELGIRWPNKDHDDIHFWNRYTLKASKDEPEEWRNCGKKGWPSCPEDHENRDWGDQDCALVKYSTLYMDELEANIAFCANSIGHTIFSREAPHIWTGLVPLTAWKNNEHQCEKWLEKNGMQALETISRRTLEAAEMGIVDPSHPEVSSDKDVQFNLDKLTA